MRKRMQNAAIVGLGLILLAAGGGFGGEDDSEGFKNPDARAAQKKYTREFDKQTEQYDAAVLKLRKRYLDDLEDVLRKVMKKGDLEEANRISAEKQAIEEAIASAQSGGKNSQKIVFKSSDVLKKYFVSEDIDQWAVAKDALRVAKKKSAIFLRQNFSGSFSVSLTVVLGTSSNQGLILSGGGLDPIRDTMVIGIGDDKGQSFLACFLAGDQKPTQIFVLTAGRHEIQAKVSRGKIKISSDGKELGTCDSPSNSWLPSKVGIYSDTGVVNIEAMEYQNG